jgi:hypothetical protein
MCADESKSGYDIFDPRNGKNNMRIGAAVFYVGIVVTIVSCAAAPRGGGFIVAYGAIGFGAIQFVGGLLQARRIKGIRHVYIKPRSPQLNGKVERSHRSDQEEFYQLLTYTDDVDLNKKLAHW